MTFIYIFCIVKIFYVDRMEILGRSVKRSFPAFHGWDSSILMKRQADEMRYGMFGDGYVAGKFAPTDVTVSQVCFGKSDVSEKGKTSVNDGMDGPTYTNELVKAAGKMNKEMCNVLRVISTAPGHVLEHPCFQIAVDAIRHIFRIPNTDLSSCAANQTQADDDGLRATQTLATDCEEWNRPEWDAWMAEMLETWGSMQHNNVLLSQNCPSFSLGLSQKPTHNLNEGAEEVYLYYVPFSCMYATS